MDEKTFPYRLNPQTLSLLTKLVSALSSHNARIQSLVQGQCALLFDKKHGIPDANIIFTPDGVELEYNLKAVAKEDKGTAQWLNRYHAFIEAQKKSTLTPVASRCSVHIKASYTGVLQYFLTYMVRYPDESIAQDTPQGLLYATSGLGIAAPKQVSTDTEEMGVW